MNPTYDMGISLLEWGITPWTVLGLALFPLLLLIRCYRAYPTLRAVALAVVVFVLSLPTPWMPAWWWVILALTGALFGLVAAIDLVSLARLGGLEVQRVMSRIASLGAAHPVHLIVANHGRWTFRGHVAEDAPLGIQVAPARHQLVLPPHSRTELRFTLYPRRRGAFQLEYIYLANRSRLGLWQQLHRLPCPSALHVYPDIKQLGEYALLARTNRLSQIGVKRTRRIGQDNNFERLRDYQRDDTYKHIDWRSTARRQKLTVRQFQTDQSQRVVFLLDCGRMMTNEYEGLSLLDYALNATLMLSYVALEQGDSVGMLCFSDRVHTYVPPSGGRRHMNRLLHAGFNQFPQLVQSRYDEAFLYLSRHCRRRSLVVLLTNVIDQVNADQIHDYMGHLIGCHLPLTVLLRDHRLFEAADHPLPDDDVLYRSAAAARLLLWRHSVIRRMAATGALTLDVFPEQMTSSLVNRYLEIKARHLL
ncbi:MAG: membrane protein [Pirellulaceae bacterium]|nr:MAG: membrane protein [Pirellulaceae bacterium]